jgi:small subunit ribosomal protein S6
MRKYETVFISDPDLKDQARQDLFDKVRNIIAKEDGILLNLDEWGIKKLAYEIKKKVRGHYTCVTFGGTGSLINELERNFRLTDDVLKFMTILLSDDVTKEQLEKELLDAQEDSQQKEIAAEVAAKEVAVEETKEEAAVEKVTVKETKEEAAVEKVTVEETKEEAAVEKEAVKEDKKVEKTE